MQLKSIDSERMDLLQLTKLQAHRDIIRWVDEFMATIQVPSVNAEIKASEENYSKATRFCFDLTVKVFDTDNYLTKNPGLIQLYEEPGEEPRIGFAEPFQVYMNYYSDLELIHTYDEMLWHINLKQQEMAIGLYNRLQTWYQEGFEPYDRGPCANNIKYDFFNLSIIEITFYEMSMFYNKLMKYINREYYQTGQSKRDDWFYDDEPGKHYGEPVAIDFGYSKNLTQVSKLEAYDGIVNWAEQAEGIILDKRDDGDDYQTIAKNYCENLVKTIFEVDDWKLSDIPYILLDYKNGKGTFKIHDSVNWIILDFSDTENKKWDVNPDFYALAKEAQNKKAQQLFKRLQIWLNDIYLNDKSIDFLKDYSEFNNLAIINKTLAEMTEFFNLVYGTWFASEKICTEGESYQATA